MRNWKWIYSSHPIVGLCWLRSRIAMILGFPQSLCSYLLTMYPILSYELSKIVSLFSSWILPEKKLSYIILKVTLFDITMPWYQYDRNTAPEEKLLISRILPRIVTDLKRVQFNCQTICDISGTFDINKLHDSEKFCT